MPRVSKQKTGNRLKSEGSSMRSTNTPGLKREIKDSYEPADSGGTRIPSAKGDFGNQEGLDKRGSPPTVYVFGDETVSIPAEIMKSQEAHKLARKSIGIPVGAPIDPSRLYDYVVALKNAFNGVSMPEVEAASTSRMFTATPTAVKLPESLAGSSISSAPPKVQSGEVKSVDPATILAAIKLLNDLIKHQSVTAPALITAPSPTAATSEESSVTPPKVEVSLSDEAAGTWTFKVHAVVSLPSMIVLVYDTRYEHGMKFVPMASPEKTYQIVVTPSDKSPTGVRSEVVLYPGVLFSYGHHEFQVYVVAPESENEDEAEPVNVN